MTTVVLITQSESLLFHYKTFFPLDSLDYWVDLRYDISFAGDTGASLCCIIITGILLFLTWLSTLHAFDISTNHMI